MAAGAYTQNANTAAAAAQFATEVANGTNLSGSTIDVLVFGR